MRISDWSSDVCSSDLAMIQMGVSARKSPQRATKTPAISAFQTRTRLNPKRWIMGVATSFMAMEIGRASCRGRVCQYGVDLGGRRIIKKKHTKLKKAGKWIKKQIQSKKYQPIYN